MDGCRERDGKMRRVDEEMKVRNREMREETDSTQKSKRADMLSGGREKNTPIDRQMDG